MSAILNRRPLLVAGVGFLLVVAGGCLANPAATEPRADDACTYDRVTPVPYPDVPDDLTRESAREFAVAFERARFYRDLAGEDANSSLQVRVANVSRSGDGWSVRLRGGFSVYQCTDGQQSVGDGFVGAKYFVDESAAYRAEAVGEDAVDARADGTRVR